MERVEWASNAEHDLVPRLYFQLLYCEPPIEWDLTQPSAELYSLI
jgi:hypothetical protein